MKELPEPKNIWKYMLAVTQIPRGSNQGTERWRHKKILAFLKQCADEIGCETYVDTGDNLIIRKAAYPGMENAPVVCLQCHMDMVVQKNDDVDINLETDPLHPRIDGPYLKATGTSLGSDDGIGIATCFAILEDKTLKHGPLEVLVTRDEETGLFGAAELEPNVLKCKYMINVDSEEENAVCVGCAGGYVVHIKLPTPRAPMDGWVTKTVVLNNFCGGHSGCDINLGRSNVIHVFARFLKALCVDYRLVSVDSGTAHNAIPRKLVAEVAVPAEKAEQFVKCMTKHFEEFKKEYHTIEKNVTLEITDSDSKKEPLTEEATRKFTNFANAFPFGVQRMSPTVEGSVETSVNCGVAKCEGDEHILFVAAPRSFSSTQLDMMYNKMKSLADMVGAVISPRIGAYPSWEPNMDSPLTKKLVESYKECTGKDPRVYSIHAGLECGLFMGKYPNLDCTSIGPTLEYPHSPEERLTIASAPRLWKVLTNALEKLAN